MNVDCSVPELDHWHIVRDIGIEGRWWLVGRGLRLDGIGPYNDDLGRDLPRDMALVLPVPGCICHDKANP